MSDPESNKIFAAILVAGIIAMLGGFIAKKLVHPHDLDQDAVPIEGAELVAAVIDQGPQLPEPVLHLIATADIARGEKLSRACAACHSFDKGGPNKVGPNMWNTVGAQKGHIEGFAYSDALLDKGGEWTYLSLNKFLWKPKEYIPGTKMNYIGLKKPEDRAAMIAWLRTLADSPEPMPTEAQIAAEKAELSPPEPEASEADEVLAAEDTADPDAEAAVAEAESGETVGDDGSAEDSADEVEPAVPGHIDY